MLLNVTFQPPNIVSINCVRYNIVFETDGATNQWLLCFRMCGTTCRILCVCVCVCVCGYICRHFLTLFNQNTLEIVEGRDAFCTHPWWKLHISSYLFAMPSHWKNEIVLLVAISILLLMQILYMYSVPDRLEKISSTRITLLNTLHTSFYGIKWMAHACSYHTSTDCSDDFRLSFLGPISKQILVFKK